MGALDKFLNYMKLNDEEDDEYYDEYYDDDDDEIIEPKKSKTSVKEKDRIAIRGCGLFWWDSIYNQGKIKKRKNLKKSVDKR